MPTATDIADTIIELEALWARFITVRAAFPKARASDIGNHDIESKHWYRRQGRHLRLSFAEPIDEQTRDVINACGYWVNQSFVVWLGSLLKEKLKVRSKPDESLPGHEHVDLAIRLRNRLVHDGGRFTPGLPSAMKAFDDILGMYDPPEPDSDKYNLHIDDVLEFMFKGVLAYVRAMADREDSSKFSKA
jgi:hypothetical protein